MMALAICARPLFLALLLTLVARGPVWALEFSADQITRTHGKTHRANIYYRDDRWRLEHQDPGPVNVTIVRKDKQVMWLIISRLKHYKEIPYDSEQAPKVPCVRNSHGISRQADSPRDRSVRRFRGPPSPIRLTWAVACRPIYSRPPLRTTKCA